MRRKVILNKQLWKQYRIDLHGYQLVAETSIHATWVSKMSAQGQTISKGNQQ